MTSLATGERVFKDDARLECYGLVDELSSLVGCVISEARRSSKKNQLAEICEEAIQIQCTLFHLSTQLSCPDSTKAATRPTILEGDVALLEKWMDGHSEKLPPLRNFILPGGSASASLSHVCRTVCRALERRLVNLNKTHPLQPIFITYINRLSDYFFVLARSFNRIEKVDEILWSAPPQKPRGRT